VKEGWGARGMVTNSEWGKGRLSLYIKGGWR
jgi:hypothetical protein